MQHNKHSVAFKIPLIHSENRRVVNVILGNGTPRKIYDFYKNRPRTQRRDRSWIIHNAWDNSDEQFEVARWRMRPQRLCVTTRKTDKEQTRFVSSHSKGLWIPGEIGKSRRKRGFLYAGQVTLSFFQLMENDSFVPKR